MKKEKRQIIRRRIRSKVTGTQNCPRAAVYRSAQRIVVQLIDDEKGLTLLAVASDPKGKGTKIEQAQEVGKQLAEAAQKAKISRVVFDRGGYQYHGRVRALADAMRDAGLSF